MKFFLNWQYFLNKFELLWGNNFGFVSDGGPAFARSRAALIFFLIIAGDYVGYY